MLCIRMAFLWEFCLSISCTIGGKRNVYYTGDVKTNKKAHHFDKDTDRLARTMQWDKQAV